VVHPCRGVAAGPGRSGLANSRDPEAMNAVRAPVRKRHPVLTCHRGKHHMAGRVRRQALWCLDRRISVGRLDGADPLGQRVAGEVDVPRTSGRWLRPLRHAPSILPVYLAAGGSACAPVTLDSGTTCTAARPRARRARRAGGGRGRGRQSRGSSCIWGSRRRATACRPLSLSRSLGTTTKCPGHWRGAGSSARSPARVRRGWASR